MKQLKPGQGVMYLCVETVVLRIHSSGVIEIKNPDYYWDTESVYVASGYEPSIPYSICVQRDDLTEL